MQNLSGVTFQINSLPVSVNIKFFISVIVNVMQIPQDSWQLSKGFLDEHEYVSVVCGQFHFIHDLLTYTPQY